MLLCIKDTKKPSELIQIMFRLPIMLAWMFVILFFSDMMCPHD